MSLQYTVISYIGFFQMHDSGMKWFPEFHTKPQRFKILHLFVKNRDQSHVTLTILVSLHFITKAVRITFVSTTLLTSCNRLVTTSRYQDAFAWLATACWRQVCLKLSTDLLQVDCQNLLSTGSLQVVSTSWWQVCKAWWNWQLATGRGVLNVYCTKNRRKN